MSPTGADAPAGALADAIVRDFGGVEQLKARFAEAGQERFGSGWVWLARTQPEGGRLQVLSTFGHENPMLQGLYPILVNDVWEHAYYLKYENRRADYLESWWAVANWEEAARRYEGPDAAARDNWEAEGGQVLAPQALSLGMNTFEFMIGLGIMLYLLFFLLRDGNTISERIREAIPLRGDQKAALFTRFADVVRATVKGSILVAIAQGSLGGIAFWFLGIHAPLLWAALMAFLSLIPAVGSALIWVPVAIYFLATGAIWQGLGLILYGVLVIGLVDNLLRPFLVGKDTKLPDYVVLISTLGGIKIFGLNGFVIGPLIAALFIASWRLYRDEQEQRGADP
jgi:predicted PurR-regulated permease PerM